MLSSKNVYVSYFSHFSSPQLGSVKTISVKMKFYKMHDHILITHFLLKDSKATHISVSSFVIVDIPLLKYIGCFK